MAKKHDHQDPVADAKAKADERRATAQAEADEREASLSAIREAGRQERERDLEADRQAQAEAAKADRDLRDQLEQQEREDASRMHDTVTRLLAEREARIDAADAEALRARLEAEEGIDPSIGPQVVLDPTSTLARAARGGLARDMRGNALAAELAMQEGA